MSAQRTCGACGGSGRVLFGKIAPYRIKCPVCEGSGQVDAKASRADAVADLETLRAFVFEHTANGAAYEHSDEATDETRMVYCWLNLARSPEAGNQARSRAHLAFRAVPGLRGDR